MTHNNCKYYHEGSCYGTKERDPCVGADKCDNYKHDTTLQAKHTRSKGVNMNYSEALQKVKEGYKVAREGWNGKKRCIYLAKGSVVPYYNLK